MANLLIPEPPLQVLPSLVLALGAGGLNKAILLQQLHWHLVGDYGAIEVEGRKWIKRSAGQWAEELPWLSSKTIERLLRELEEMKVVLSRSNNSWSADRTKSYSIDEEAVDRLPRKRPVPQNEAPCTRIEGMHAIESRAAIGINLHKQKKGKRLPNGGLVQTLPLDPTERKLFEERENQIADIVLAVSEITKRNPATSNRLLAAAATTICDMHYTAKQVRTVFPKWYAQNWRAKGGLPTPHQLAELLPEAIDWSGAGGNGATVGPVLRELKPL